MAESRREERHVVTGYGGGVGVIQVRVKLGVDNHAGVAGTIQLYLKHPGLNSLDGAQGTLFSPRVSSRSADTVRI